MNLGMNLQKARKRKSLSQEEVAQSLEVSRQCVSLWENDQTQPTLDNLDALSELYGVSAAVLLGQIPFPEDIIVEQKPIPEDPNKILERKHKASFKLFLISLIIGICNALFFVVPGLGLVLSITGFVLGILSRAEEKDIRGTIAIVIHSVYFVACITALFTNAFYNILNLL